MEVLVKLIIRALQNVNLSKNELIIQINIGIGIDFSIPFSNLNLFICSFAKPQTLYVVHIFSYFEFGNY